MSQALNLWFARPKLAQLVVKKNQPFMGSSVSD